MNAVAVKNEKSGAHARGRELLPAFGPAVFTLAPSRARRLKKVNTMKKILTIIAAFALAFTLTECVAMGCGFGHGHGFGHGFGHGGGFRPVHPAPFHNPGHWR